jgi:hypothetical protein
MIDNAKGRRQFADPLDSSAEVDFRGGERGKYAHRFGEVARDEELAAEFLRDKGFEVVPIAQNRFAKTPDFRLMKRSKLVAYCEVKTFERDEWINKMLDAANPGELVGGGRRDPIYNRIANAIHTAAKQLEDANSNHDVLSVLLLVNRDKMAKYQDLVSVIAGKWDPLAGIHDRAHLQFSEGRIRQERFKIDLYIWLDAFADGAPRVGGFFFGNYENRPRACSLFGIRDEAVKTVAL